MTALRKNRILQAFFKLMLISAGLHITILLIHFFFTGDISLFNFFRIIELDLFFPHLMAGSLGDYFSSFAVGAIYLFSFFYLTESNK